MADWQIRAAWKGDLRRAMQQDLRAAEGAVSTVVRRKTTILKNRVRKDIKGAGLGVRLGKTARDQTFPGRGQSINMKGRVVSKAIYKRPGGLVDLLTVFDEGATVTARGSGPLWIVRGVGYPGGVRRARTVRIAKRLSLQQTLDQTGADIDAQVAKEWERRSAKAGIQ